MIFTTLNICKTIILTVALFGFAGFSALAQPEPTPEQMARAQTLYKEIRCPVCTAQPISESDASLSQNMREKILSDIVAGKSDVDILNDLTRTYGDDIRLLPKTEARTLPLWLAPWTIIIVGGGVLIVARIRRARIPGGSTLDTPTPE